MPSGKQGYRGAMPDQLRTTYTDAERAAYPAPICDDCGRPAVQRWREVTAMGDDERRWAPTMKDPPACPAVTKSIDDLLGP